MTALDGLERLEAPALWRAEPGAQRREVYVKLGNAELVIEDKLGDALSHWSLPALVRRAQTGDSVTYAPAVDAGEELEVDEPEIIAALDRVIAAVAKGRQRPGSLRRLSFGLVLGFTVGIGVLWLPGALRSHTAQVMPAAQRAEIGTELLRNLTALTGSPCANPTGTEALALLRDRLFATTPIDLVVLQNLPEPALALPGGTIAVSNTILVQQDDPDVAAGHILAAALTARETPPLDEFLSDIGFVNLLRAYASGHTPPAAVVAHAEQLILDPPARPAPEVLQSGFNTALIAWQPYAIATGLPTGEDPPARLPPALDDTAWQLLREICVR